MTAGWQRYFISDLMPAERELEQRRIGDECAAGFESREPAGVIERSSRLHKDSLQPWWPAQARKIRERIGPCPRRQAESTIQQAIPDLRRDEMVRVSHDFDVIHFAERDVDRELVAQGLGCVGRIRFRIERVDVANECALLVREVGNGGIVRIETGGGSVRIARVLRNEIVGLEPEQSQVSPDTGVEFLRVHKKE